MTAGLEAGLGLIILALAITVPVLIIVSLRKVQRNIPVVSQTDSSHVSPNSSHTTEAILIVQSGGRVEYINDLAREWFGLRPDELPDLEQLLRRVRPMEDFIELCARQGQKRISIGGQLIEVTSYLVPGPDLLMLVAMRNIEFSKNLAESKTDSSILQLITDFGTNISASLNLESTLHAILLNVSHLVPADLLEVKTWDASHKTLATYVLDVSGAANVQLAPRSHFEGLTEVLISQLKPLLISDTRDSTISFPNWNANSPVKSYLGLPLIVDDHLIGTLEFGHLSSGTLGQQDLDLVKLISPQTAYSISNAMLYTSEQNRSTELSGLANLAQAFGTSQDHTSLIGRLVASVKSLFNVDVLGFLLYDESKNTLEAQSPFQGLPSHIVDIYRTTILSSSPAEMIILGRKPIITRNAAEDQAWRELGLQNLSQAASLRESVLEPLISGDRLVGYFQVSNHKQSALEFSESELRLINIVATQAAGIIENEVIVEQTRQRALRSDALRRIASLAASSATLEETLRFSMQEVAHLFQGDLAAIFLYDEQIGELRLHEESVIGAAVDLAGTLARLHMDASQYRFTVSSSQKPFISGHLSSDRRVLPGYRTLVTTLQVESAIVVPLVVRERSIGELMLASRKAEFFNNYDLQIVSTAAGLLASAIEDATRATSTDETLRRRVEDLTTITRVSRELNSMVDINSLLEIVRDESLQTTRAECGTILLFDMTASTNPLPVTLWIGCQHADNFSPAELEVITTGTPKIFSELGKYEQTPPHEGIQSTMIVPIIDQGKTIGLIYLHSERTHLFDDTSLEVIQTLASQAAVAIGNANRYQGQRQFAERYRRRADALTKLSESSSFVSFDQPLEQSLKTVAGGIREATSFGAVLISIYESETSLLRRVVGVGFPPETLNELLARRQPLSSIQQLLKPQFRVSRSYFIPVDKAPIIPADVHMVTLEADGKGKDSPNAWDHDDFLLIPLEDNQGNPLGLISLDSPRDGLRPDRATIETLEIYATQAALLIYNHLRFTTLRTQVESLSSGMERQQRLLTVTQNDLPILLRKDLDQTIAIQNLDQRSQRVRAGLAITESVSRQLDSSSALQALGRETLTQLGMSVAIIAETANDGPKLVHVLGSIPRATNPEALFGQRNPLRACLQTGEAILIASLDEDLEWRETPLLTALRAKSLVCLPIKIDKKTVAAMLALSPEPLPSFTTEDLQVYHQIARQTSVILQNISLLNETRRRLQEVNLLLDFSRQLRGLDADHIVRSLLESARRALSAAHAGVVLIWDEHASQLNPEAVSGYADNDAMKRIWASRCLDRFLNPGTRCEQTRFNSHVTIFSPPRACCYIARQPEGVYLFPVC